MSERWAAPSAQRQLFDSPRPNAIASERDRDAERRREERSSVREVEVHDRADPVRREVSAADPERWLRTYQAGVFFKPFDRDQRRIIYEVYRRIRDGGQKVIIARRGGGKSSIFRGLQLMAFLEGIARFLPIFGKSFSEGRGNLDKQKRQLQTNELLYQDYPEICCFVRALGGIPQRARGMLYQGAETYFEWGPDHIIGPSIPGSACAGSVITAAGVEGSSIRGSSYATASGEIIRPWAVMLDDLQDEESSRSSTQSTQLIELIHSAIGGQRGEGETMAIVGAMTIICADDAADRLSNRKLYPQWNGDRMRTIYQMPERMDLWAEYEDIIIRSLNDTALEVSGGHDCEEARAFVAARQEEMHRGAVVCSDYMHIPRALVHRALACQEAGDPLLADHGGDPYALEYLHALASRDGYRIPVSALHYAMNERIRLGEAAFEAEFNGVPRVLRLSPILTITPHLVMSRVSGVPRGVVPAGHERLMVGIDPGKESLHVVVIGYTQEGRRGHVVDYGTYAVNAPAGDARERDSAEYRALELAIYSALAQVRARIELQPYQTVDGRPVPVDTVCVDVQFMPSAINRICDERKYWHSMRGYGRNRTLPKPAHDCIVTQHLFARRLGAGGRWLHYQDADAHKRFVHEGFAVPPGGPGSLSLWGASMVDHRPFADQVCAEVYVEDGAVMRWKMNNPTAANHFLDATALCYVGATRRGLSVFDPHTLSADPALQDLDGPSPAPTGQEGHTVEWVAEPPDRQQAPPRPRPSQPRAASSVLMDF